eukprot:scaffold135573_cov35-Cyclotella_meneghiniana.AAC.1
MEIENETTDTDMEWKIDEMDKFLAEELAIIEMIITEEKRQSSITEYFSSETKLKTMKDTEHTPNSNSRETTMLQIICGMQECNNRLRYKRIGKAARMIALLRRCLYPKRDVIRWEIDKNEDICPRRQVQPVLEKPKTRGGEKNDLCHLQGRAIFMLTV